jgi:hypothetical protein
MYDLYSAKIRLAGKIENEVVKNELTAPEIYVLRHLHGADAVLDIKATKQKVRRSEDQERARLAKLYRNGPETAGERLVAGIFGVAGALPTTVPTVSFAEVEEYDDSKDEIVTEAPIERTPVKKPDAAASLMD